MRTRPVLFLIILLTCCTTQNEAHVVFEEMGQMVGSVSYLHCAISLNLTTMDDMIFNATNGLTDWFKRMTQLYRWTTWTEGSLTKGQSHDQIYYKNLYDVFNDSLHHLDNKVQQFKKTLPQPPAHTSRVGRALPSEIIQAGGKILGNMISSPNFFVSLAQGVFGTFMGLYNAHQLHKLRQEIRTVEKVQERLVTVVTDHEARIRRVETGMKYLLEKATVDSWLNAPLVASKIDRIRADIQDALTISIHAAQAAQQHRLAIDLLSPLELNNLYQSIQTRADQLRYHLLTRMATDLFQVEVSYLYDGNILMLILHVPMVPKQTALSLYRLHPFPIPFSSQRALLPKTSTSVLAVSHESPRLMDSIELVDLMNCHRINSIYICERHGVLSRNIRATCLGALFENNLELAQQLCELQLVPYQEVALQLESNWFLIYSPKMFTSFGRCLNGSALELQIIHGVNKLFLDPSCSTDLQDLVLTSDISFQLDSTVKHFKWSQADLATFGVSDQDISETINDLDSMLTEQELLLSEVLAHKKMRARVPWIWIWIILGTLGLIAAFTLIMFSFNTRLIHRLRRRLQVLRHTMGPVPVVQPVEEVELQALQA